MQTNQKSLETSLPDKMPTILVIDDQPANIQSINAILSGHYRVLAATSAALALEICQQSQPDLIISDVVMPQMTGLQLCQLLAENQETKDIPVIFMTSFSKPEEENACWQSGGADFITKPVQPMTLKNRVNAQLKFKAQKEFLAQLAFVDGLTAVYNRRYFDLHIVKLTARADRGQGGLSILLIDIDFFKLFNDNYGHLAGDSALCQVASVIKATLLRPLDFVSRYGGEEFVVVLPETDAEGALQVAARIQKNVADRQISHKNSTHKVVTVSIGVACYQADTAGYQTLIEKADKSLYAAKKSGRNKVSYCNED
jgi:diguanylate cyclase (GGDEF)-like protein